MIPIPDMIPRGIYKIKSRNLTYGVWNPDTNGFIGIREKFGDKYLFTEYHYDIGAPYGTVRDAEFVSVLPDEIFLAEHQCPSCEVPLAWLPDPSTETAERKRSILTHLGDDCNKLAHSITTYKSLFNHLDAIERPPLQRIIDASLGIDTEQ